MSQLSHFQSPIYYSWQTKLGLWRGWGSGGGPPHPVRDEKSCLRPWFVAWKLWSDGVVHCKPYADWLFYLALNSKTCRVPGIYPRLHLFKKNEAIICLVVIRCTFVIWARLKFARWISLELHENDTKKLMQVISLILRDWYSAISVCDVNVASYDNQFLFNFLLFAFFYDNLIAIRCI